MKKIMASLMALALALSLAACGETPADSSSTAPSSQAPVSSQAPSSQASVAPPSVEPEEPSLNLALNGTAIADGDSNGMVIANLNDGNITTRWQALAKDPETEDNVSWFGIEWDEAQTFDTLFVEWESAHPLEGGFRVEISDDGETWTEVEFTAVRDGVWNEEQEVFETDHQTDNIVLSEVAVAKYVRIVCFTHYTVPEGLENAGNTKSPSSVYEFEIYYSVDVEAAENESSETASEEAESTDDTVAE